MSNQAETQKVVKKEANGPNPEEKDPKTPAKNQKQKSQQRNQPPVGRIIVDLLKTIAIEESQVRYLHL